MTTRNKTARLAGLLYLLLFPTTGAWYATSQALTTGDAATVLTQVETGRLRLQLAITAGAIGALDYLFLGLVLYALFSATSKAASRTLLVLVAASVPIFLAAVARQMDVLSLLEEASALGRDQLQMQILLALRGYNNLFLVTNIFSGLWLIPLGWLVYRCGFMPKFAGVLLVMGSVFYLGSFVGPLFDPRYQSTILGRTIGVVSGVPGFVGEFSTIVLLLIRGARQSKTQIDLADAAV